MLQKHFFLNKIIGQITVFDGKKIQCIHQNRGQILVFLPNWMVESPFFHSFLQKKTRKGGAPKLYVGSYNPHTIDIP